MLILLIAACSKTSPIQNDPPISTPSDSQTAAAKPDPQLQNQISEIASTAKGRVGVSAVVLETGETVSLNPSEHFPMQSVYKLPISMAVMKQVDAGKTKLDQKVRVNKDDFARFETRTPTA